jgi:hypothetical protein
MYYKLYRRRYTIYTIITILFIIVLLNNNLNSIDESTNYDKNSHDSNNLNKNVKRFNNVRINMQNYVVPDPCNDCPGENGKAVYLSVNLIISSVVILKY